MSAEFNQTSPSAMEDAEPKADRSNAPILLIAILALLVFWGMIYLDNYGGGFNPKVYQPYASYADVEAKQPVSSGDNSKLGLKVFSTYCAVCHQVSGKGLPGQFPPLAGSEWVNAEGPNRVIRIVLNGLHGQIQVEGQNFDNVMLPWKDTLKDDEIAAVLTFVRGDKDWGNKAAAVTPEQVKAIRAQIADKADNWTAPELLQIPDK